MTLQLLHSEFPYIWGKFYLIFISVPSLFFAWHTKLHFICSPTRLDNELNFLTPVRDNVLVLLSLSSVDTNKHTCVTRSCNNGSSVAFASRCRYLAVISASAARYFPVTILFTAVICTLPQSTFMIPEVAFSGCLFLSPFLHEIGIMPCHLSGEKIYWEFPRLPSCLL